MREVVVGYDKTDERWYVVDGAQRVSRHRLKQRAEKEGRRYAKKHRPSELLIETKAGNISYTQRYD